MSNTKRYETQSVIPTSGLDEARQIKTIYTNLVILFNIIIIIYGLRNEKKIKNLQYIQLGQLGTNIIAPSYHT